MPNEETTCCNCKKVLDAYEAVKVQDKFYCEICFNNHFCRCALCSEIIKIEDGIYIRSRDETVCDLCFHMHFFICYSCNGIYYIDNSYCLSHNYYCESCWSELPSCRNCGDICQTLDFDDLCPDCAGTADANGIHDHSYQPRYNYYTGKHEIDDHGQINPDIGKLFFGFELEIEKVESFKSLLELAEVIDNINLKYDNAFFYNKEDSSLTNGFEIVSHPFTWTWFKENKKQIDEIFILKEQGCRSYQTESCGLHFHLSKNAFTTFHLYKLLKFFYENKYFVEVISQRSSGNLSHWAGFNENDQANMKLIAKEKSNSTDSERRYVCINTTPEKTIEIRIFRGTLNKQGFYKALEFVKAIFEFTLINPPNKICTHEFISFIKKNKKEYLNLYIFLIHKNYIEEEEKSGLSKEYCKTVQQETL